MLLERRRQAIDFRNKNIKKIKHGIFFRNFFEIIKILIFIFRFLDFGGEVF